MVSNGTIIMEIFILTNTDKGDCVTWIICKNKFIGCKSLIIKC